MAHTTYALNGMVSAPHHAAAAAGAEILRRGGNAVEAAVTAAAVLGVVYPHMTGLGGDALFLISPKYMRERGEPPVYVEGIGRSGRRVTRELYLDNGLEEMPRRGPLAAVTVAGAPAAWQRALEVAAELPGAGLPLPALLEEAIVYAENGFAVTHSQHDMTSGSLYELIDQPGFADSFLPFGRVPPPGARLRLPALAETLRRLGREGLSAFYRSESGREPLARPWAAGSPLMPEDLAACKGELRPPLGKHLFGGTIYNSPAPTQGAASLMILGLLERCAEREGLGPQALAAPATLAHLTTEAVRLVFALRDRFFADPAYMQRPAEDFLADEVLSVLTDRIPSNKAKDEPLMTPGGDTVWFGATDRHGTVVSAIQSLYHEFGSGVVLGDSGITWQNRSLGFAFEPDKPNSLAPAKQPFHTLNPALAVMDDGRCIAYGSMGGDGQPQTQAAVFIRAVVAGMPLRDAINAPRWLLGRAWGDHSTSLKLEASFPPDVFWALRRLGHEVASVPARSSLMGHAGAVVLHPDGLMEGAADERGDGAAAGI